MAVCELEKVSKSFGDKVILRDFSMEVERGDFLCITGESGAGKTTLLNIIGLLEKPDRGTVSLFGHKNVSVNSTTARKLLKDKIGFLFQNFGLIDDKTVADNLNIACKISKIPRSKWKVEQEKILSDLNVNARLKEPVYKLSGGEQQRIALARTILKGCELILADEPTGSLDARNSEIIVDRLERLQKEGVAVVMVTHDPALTARCRRVIRLKPETKRDSRDEGGEKPDSDAERQRDF